MDGYVLTHDYISKNGNAHIKIYQPILTEEERAKRMAAIHKAAVNLAIANRKYETQQRKQGKAGT